MFDTPITTSDLSINKVLSTGLPVALVFLDGAPSSEITEELKRLARETAGDMLVVQIQVKGNPQSVQKYDIRWVPAVVTIKAGKEMSRTQNASAQDIRAHILYLAGKGPRPVEVQEKPANSQERKTSSDSWRNQTSSQVAGKPIPVKDNNFDKEVIQSSIPVLVDFWATWCGPCRMTEPVVEKLAHEYQGKLKVAKVNVDENPYLSQKYNVMSIPTMMIVKNGQIVDRWMGALPEQAMRNRIVPKI